MMKRMDVADSSGPHGPRDGWFRKDASFQFVNVNDSLKIDKGTRALIRSRATWSSYHSIENVALDKPDRKKQMRRFRLQPPLPKTFQPQARRSLQRHAGLTDSHKFPVWRSGLSREPLNRSQSILDESTDGKMRMNPLEKKQFPNAFRRYIQQDSEVFWSIPSGLTYTNPANALTDPFDVLPLPINSREDLLLKHCKTTFFPFMPNFLLKLHVLHIKEVLSLYISFTSPMLLIH
jgi:hypothetical protein